MKIVSSSSMSDIDRQAIENFDIPSLLLMENAGIKCWTYIDNYIKTSCSRDKNIVIVAGSGNNGGDVLVIARQAWISGLRTIKIILISDKGNDMVCLHRKICKNYGIPVLIYRKNDSKISSTIEAASIIIDGVTGTGLQGVLRGTAANIVSLINSNSAVKISIDLPSGLGEDFKPGYPVINADITLTIELPKIVLYNPSMRCFSGKIVVLSIGFPPTLLENPVGAGEIYTSKELLLPNIPNWAYKGIRGHTAVFAGSEGTVGAAVLSASAAGRARSGLVTLYCNSSVYKIVAPQLKSAMVKKLDNEEDCPVLDSFSSLLVGPGWGKTGRGVLLKKLFRSNIPGVLDADGIDVLLGLDNVIQINNRLNGARWVFTPHPGEFERLSSVDKEIFLLSPLPYLKKVAAKYNAVIVLKSHVTFIVTPEGDYSIVDGMNPSMGTGGSGDILAGIIAGFLAQGMDSYISAVMGVVLHQHIGRVCFAEKGWFLAEDLLPYISSMLKKGIPNAQ